MSIIHAEDVELDDACKVRVIYDDADRTLPWHWIMYQRLRPHEGWTVVREGGWGPRRFMANVPRR
jgi:hypothetical protein